MVYLIAVICALAGAYINNRLSPKGRKLLLTLLCTYIILIIGFRYKVGVDTISYMKAYRYIPPLEDFSFPKTLFSTRYEPAFVVICGICKSFTNQFWPVQLIVATITSTCIFIFLYRYCKNVFIGVLFYFLLQGLYFSTEVLRESAAVGIFLLNFKNLQEKRWLNYYLLSLLSILFHYSAIIIWFLPLARILKPNILFLILCVCFLSVTPLVEKLNNLLQIAALSGRITMYVNAAQDLNFNWRLGELIHAAFPAIIVLTVCKLLNLKNEFQYLILLQILLCMGAFAIPLIFSRFTNYTTMFVTVSLANLLTLPRIKTWLKALIISGVLLTQTYYYYSMADRWFPYVSIFYPEEIPLRNQLYRHFFLPWLRQVK